MIHEEKTNTYDAWRFDSFGDFVHFADTRTAATSMIHSRKISEPDYNGKIWSGTRTFEETLGLANAGWEEGTKKVKALSQILMDKVTSLVVKTTLEYNVTGNDFDVPMFLTGEPEHWYTQVEHIDFGKGTRAIRLVFNAAASSGVDTEIIIAKGAAIAALVECLEFSGYRVDLMLAEAGRSYSGYQSLIMIPVKAADQPLDMDRLTFALAHPATLRRLMFSVMESSKQFCDICGEGYGQPQSLEESERGDVYIDKSFLGEPQWKDVDSTVAWLLKTLKEQGIQVEGLQEVPA